MHQKLIAKHGGVKTEHRVSVLSGVSIWKVVIGVQLSLDPRVLCTYRGSVK